MQNSRRLTVVAIVVVIVSLLWWAFPKRDRVEASAVADSSSSPFAERTIVLPGSDVELSPRYLGTLSSRTDSAFATKLAAGMQAAKTGAGAVPQRREPRTQNEIPEHLLPKAPDLSDEQRANLSRLRWGESKDLKYRGDGGNATVRWLSATALALPLNPGTETSEQLARRFIEANRALFLLHSAADELSLSGKEPDRLGGEVIRFQQVFQGLQVWPAGLTANINQAGNLAVVTGAYIPTPVDVSVEPKITPESALAAVVVELAADAITDVEVHSGPTLKIYTASDRAPELSFEVIAEHGSQHQRIFVSARTGDVLASISEICEVATTGSGVDVLGVSRPLNVFFESGTYYLVDISKPMFDPATWSGAIRVGDATDPTNPVYVTSTNATSGWDVEGVSAAFNLSRIYDFFHNALNRKSFDGHGADIVALVRYPDPKTGAPMRNAFWNGEFMAFGLGDRYSASSDVVAHEFSHAVIGASANLSYRDESGAINESMSDILGECFENHLTGANDWLIGSQLTTHNVGGALRSMANPALGNQPVTMSDFDHTSADNGGVHINSGIPNHAFYLLATGLPEGGIGIEAARDIFYRALVTKLNQNSDFHDLRTACVQSATELFGAGSEETNRTRQAFDSVFIFDRASLPPPSDLTPPVGADSYLISYEAVDGNYYLGRREAAFGETGFTVKAISSYAVDQDSRPTITANGLLAAHITAGRNIAFSATDGTNEEFLDFGGLGNAISISADGNYLALILRDASTNLPKPEIYYYDVAKGTGEFIPLYLPVADGPASIQLTTVDEVDLSPDGQYALFDGMAESKLPDGSTVRGWTIFGVDLRSKQIFALLPPSNTAAYGNPSFARTSTERFVFETLSLSASDGGILAVDAGRGKSSWVRYYAPAEKYLAYPRYSAADDFIVYADDYFSLSRFSYQPRVSRISLLADKVTPTGSPITLQDLAVGGLSYRRGDFIGAPVIAVQALAASIPKGASGTFRISRVSGDRNIPVSISFKPTGTAIPDQDYATLSNYASLAADQDWVDVNVTSLLKVGSADKTLTLTLDPLMRYVVSETSGSASLILAGADPSYDEWADTEGVGAAIEDADADGLANLLEYALGSDPTVPTTNAFTIQKTSDGLLTFVQLRLTRNLKRAGLTFALQRSSDDVSWTVANTAVVADTDSELVLRDSLAVQEGQLRALRVVVTETVSGANVASQTGYWAAISIGDTNPVYNTQPQPVSVTTLPTGFDFTVSYDGQPNAPINAGSYAVSVQAANYSNLIGQASATLTIAKANQAIIFGSLPDLPFQPDPITLSAYSDSELPVSIAWVSGNATLDGTTLRLEGVGEVTLRLEQAGNANWHPAELVKTFRVRESYAWWVQSQFAASEWGDPLIVGPLAAHSYDKSTNLVKYALGLDARDELSSDWFEVGRSGTLWTYEFRRPADRPDVSIRVESSSDLVNWSESALTLRQVDAVEGMERWQASVPVSTERIFFRLKVTQNE